MGDLGGSGFFHRIGIGYYIISLVAFGGLLIYLNKQQIRAQFPISKKTQWLTLGISAAFSGLLGLI